jgi:DNA polymerase III delta prime subunit
MAQESIHGEIEKKLNYFYNNSKIPNIIFHGPPRTGKKTLVFNFIDKIYDSNKEKIKEYVMTVNCSHGKGIKFIREDLKLFSKTNISSTNNGFKTIVLLNADFLTIDAQSALRRCIELFTHTTRFFLIVQNKYNLLKPILSRFCEFYVPEKKINDNINLNDYIINLNTTYKSLKKKKQTSFKKIIQSSSTESLNNLVSISESLYLKGFSALDFVEYIEKNNFDNLSDSKKYEIVFTFHKIKKDFRSEKFLLFILIYFVYIRSDYNLENISFI